MKKLRVFCLLMVLVTFVAGCAGGTPKSTTAEPTKTPEPAAKTFQLTYNQLEANEHPQGITMNKFKEKIEELSGGQIKVTTYALGQLYNQAGEVSALKTGDLSMSNIAFQDIAKDMPEADMFAAPYTFVNYDHMKKIFASDVFSKDFYKRVADKCGYTPLAAMTQGQRLINTKKTEPIMKPEDLKGTILRMPNAPAWIAAGESLGASVTAVAISEVYTALQTGVVDAQDNPLPGTYSNKFYEVTKQISLTNHIIDCKLICINNGILNQMNDQQKQWMYEAAKYAAEEGTKATLAEEARLLDVMKQAGLIITQPDINAFKEYSHKYYVDKGLTAKWDMKLYDAIQALNK